MKKVKGWIATQENRTCPICLGVVPTNCLCQGTPDAYGTPYYHYCSTCKKAVGGRIPRGYAIKRVSCLDDLPFAARKATAKKVKFSVLPPNADGTLTAAIRLKMHSAEELRTMPYSHYLLTHHWRRTRNEALSRAKHACQLCNYDRTLNVHHRTYERRGCELPEDLTVLCKACHEKFHNIMPKEPDRATVVLLTPTREED